MSKTKIKVKKLREDAVLPTFATEGSIGFDLTILERGKHLGGNTYVYHTGIAIEPPKGYYTEVVPRSSISKTGYILANSVGIVDNDYRGEVLVVLTKLHSGDYETPDILAGGPIRIAQLIIRKEVKLPFEIVTELSDTKRGAGALGSTGKK